MRIPEPCKPFQARKLVSNNSSNCLDRSVMPLQECNAFGWSKTTGQFTSTQMCWWHEHAQQCPFPFPRPDNWPDEPSPAAYKRWGAWHLPVQLVVLPTYASWCHPIEKLWRMLKQEILHWHRQADDLQGLRQRVMAFLQQFAPGSLSLLRYVGLLPNSFVNVH